MPKHPLKKVSPPELGSEELSWLKGLPANLRDSLQFPHLAIVDFALRTLFNVPHFAQVIIILSTSKIAPFTFTCVSVKTRIHCK